MYNVLSVTDTPRDSEGFQLHILMHVHVYIHECIIYIYTYIYIYTRRDMYATLHSQTLRRTKSAAGNGYGLANTGGNADKHLEST